MLDSPLDKTTALNECPKYFVEFKNSLEIVDSWRYKNSDKTHYTYHKPGNLKYGSRIDYILCSKNLLSKMLCSEIYPVPLSDHDAVATTFKGEIRTRGKGYWKLNTSIIGEQDYKDGIRVLIKETMEEYCEDKQVLWEIIKIRVREFSIKYCIIRKRNNIDSLRNLELKLKTIKEALNEGKQDPSILDEKIQLEKEIDLFVSYQSRGAQVRSRARWVEEGKEALHIF